MSYKEKLNDAKKDKNQIIMSKGNDAEGNKRPVLNIRRGTVGRYSKNSVGRAICESAESE